MPDIFLISDTHFLHTNIIEKFDPPRPFHNIHEHDEALIENWNKVVKSGDKVYHLGDVFMGNPLMFKNLWPRLNGRKTLIVGNHDNIKWLSAGGFFSNIHMWRKLSEHGLVLSHVPLHPTTLGEARRTGKQYLNVHGHTHFNGSPEGPYKSVCVEKINYTPIHIEDIKL